MNKFGKFGRIMLAFVLGVTLTFSGVQVFDGRSDVPEVYAAAAKEYEAWAANGDITSAKNAALTDLKDYYTTLVVGLKSSKKKEVKKLSP